jgi:Transposase DDE domain
LGQIDALTKKLTSLLSVGNINRIAKQTGFCKRKSKFTPMMFLKMVLFDHLQADRPSLQQHSFGIQTDEGEKISKQGIGERFTNHAVGFLMAILQHYLENQLSAEQLPSHLKEKFTSIRVMDSTEFKVHESLCVAFPGYSGSGTKACAAVQFEFDILTGKVNHLSLENARVSDKTYASGRMATLREGDLLLRDLGYYSVSTYSEIESRKAFYVSRLNPQLLIYEKKRGVFKELSHGGIIKRLRASGKMYLDIPVYIGKDTKHPVRLIANLLDEEAVAHRIKNKMNKKQKLNKADKLTSRVNLFVTNMAKKLCGTADIYRLYKIRWQVELMFKTWKSVLNIDKVRKMKADRLKCYLISKLLWVMLSWEVCVVHQHKVWEMHQRLISHYKCFSLLKLQAAKIKRVLFSSAQQIKHWIESMLDCFVDHGLKENRKGRINLIDLLKMNKANTTC